MKYKPYTDLMGFGNEYQSGGWLDQLPDVSVQGYKKNSPDRNKKELIIPSNQITMDSVQHPVFGRDNLGNTQMMYPGNNYQFPGSFVHEVPIKNKNSWAPSWGEKMQSGGKTPIYVNDPHDPRLQAYQDSLKEFHWRTSTPGPTDPSDPFVRYWKPKQPVIYQTTQDSKEDPSKVPGGLIRMVGQSPKPRPKQQLQSVPISDLKQFPVNRQEPQPDQIDINSLNPNPEEWLSPQTTPFRPAGFYKKNIIPGQPPIPTRQEGGQTEQDPNSNFSWLSEDIQQPQLQNPKRNYKGRQRTKPNRSQYLPHPSVLQQGGWADPNRLATVNDPIRGITSAPITSFEGQHLIPTQDIPLVDLKKKYPRAENLKEKLRGKNIYPEAPNGVRAFLNDVLTAPIQSAINMYEGPDYYEQKGRSAGIDFGNDAFVLGSVALPMLKGKKIPTPATQKMPYSGNFSVEIAKKTKGKTEMPYLTETPQLNKEQQILQSYGLDPNIKKISNITDKDLAKLNKTNIGIHQNVISPEFSPLEIGSEPHPFSDKTWYRIDPEDYQNFSTPAEKNIAYKDASEAFQKIFKNDYIKRHPSAISDIGEKKSFYDPIRKNKLGGKIQNNWLDKL